MNIVVLAAWAVLTVGGAWLLWLTVPGPIWVNVLALMWGIFTGLIAMLLWSWLSGRST